MEVGTRARTHRWRGRRRGAGRRARRLRRRAGHAGSRRRVRGGRDRARRAAAQPAAPAAASENGKSFVSPVVARIASEHGIDPAQVPGTGTGGRVTKKDIQAFIDGRPPAPRRRSGGRTLPRQPLLRRLQRPRRLRLRPTHAPAVGEQLEPMSAMRRGIAEHMRRSLDTSAHVTSAIEVDMSKVVALRGKLKKEYESALRRQPDLPRVHRARDRRDAARLPVGER